MTVAILNRCATISGMSYVDAHCHLNSGDRLLPDVAMAITNAVNMSDWEYIAIFHGDGGIYGAIGIHPWHVSDLSENWAVHMRELLMANPKLMVGEIGIDKNHPDMDTQMQVFKTCLQMSADLKRVAHIHCVGAWDKVLGALSEFTPPAIVFHNFSASFEIIKELLRYNSFFSFGRAISNPQRVRAINALCSVPQNRILSESDSGTPADVVPVVQNISNILDMPVADMTNIIYNNAMELLKNG